MREYTPTQSSLSPAPIDTVPAPYVEPSHVLDISDDWLPLAFLDA